MTTSFATSTLARFWYSHAKTVLGWISSCELLLPARPLTLQKRNIQTEISRKVLNALFFFLNPKGNMEANLAATVTKVPKVEVEVQIIDLKEVYDKKALSYGSPPRVKNIHIAWQRDTSQKIAKTLSGRCSGGPFSRLTSGRELTV